MNTAHLHIRSVREGDREDVSEIWLSNDIVCLIYRE